MAAKIWQYIRPILAAILFSSTWIALGAVSLYLGTLHFFQVPIHFYQTFFVFAATFFAYNFLKIKGLSYAQNQSLWHQWLRIHLKVQYSYITVIVVLAILTLFQLKSQQWIVIMLTTLLSFMYFGVGPYSIRKYSLLKIPFLAFVWTFFIVGFALFPQISKLNLPQALHFSFLFFVWMMALCLPFEIKDLQVDLAVKNPGNLAAKIGVKRLQFLSYFLLLLALFWAVFFLPKVLYAIFPLILLTILGISKSKENSNDYFYSGFLDALLLLFFPLMYCFIH